MVKTEKKLTARQEAFCRAYVETGNASEAYRLSFSTENMKDTTIRCRAYDLMKEDRIVNRIKKIQKTHVDRHEITMDSILTELSDAFAIAKEDRAPAAMISATMSKAKLLGFLVEKKDVTVHSKISSLSDEELNELIDDMIEDADEDE